MPALGLAPARQQIDHHRRALDFGA